MIFFFLYFFHSTLAKRLRFHNEVGIIHGMIRFMWKKNLWNIFCDMLVTSEYFLSYNNLSTIYIHFTHFCCTFIIVCFLMRALKLTFGQLNLKYILIWDCNLNVVMCNISSKHKPWYICLMLKVRKFKKEIVLSNKLTREFLIYALVSEKR